jgi:cysteine desulfurase
MIYFDNNATTRLAPEASEAMRPFFDVGFANPSTARSADRLASTAIEQARESLASLIGANSTDEIVFTSGGTESDNRAVNGALAATGKRHIVTTLVEHEAVRSLCENLETSGVRVTWLSVDENGSIDLDELSDSLTAETALVSLMLANNETGVIFPVREIGEIVRAKSNAIFHVDGVAAVGKIPINLSETAIDLFSVSAHKFHGPKGVGALYIRNGVKLPPDLIGGAWEDGKRSVHQFAGLVAAAKCVSDLGAMEEIARLRDRLEHSILDTIPATTINGGRENRLPNTSNISFKDTNGEMIMSLLDEAGITVSTGSACNSTDHTPSSVLTAMNIPYTSSMGSIRFAFSKYNTDAEVEILSRTLPQIIRHLRELAGF